MRPSRSVSVVLLALLALATWPGFFLVIAFTGQGFDLIGTDQEAVFPIRTLALITTGVWATAVAGFLAFMARR